MGTEFWWFFDALVVIVAIYVIFSNAKRGVTKVWILGIGYFLAVLTGTFMAMPLAETMYNSVAVNSDMQAIERVNKHVNFVNTFCTVIDNHKLGFYAEKQEVQKRISGSDAKKFVTRLWLYMNVRNDNQTILHPNGERMTEAEFEAELREALVKHYGELLGKELPEYVRVCFEEKLASNPKLMVDLIVQYSIGGNACIEYIEDTYVREPTLEMLAIFGFFMVFSVVIVIAAVISSAVENKFFFNNTYRKERVAGGLIGIVEAAAMLILMTLLVRLLVMLGGGDLLCFNEPTIAESKIFRFLYDHRDFIIRSAGS